MPQTSGPNTAYGLPKPRKVVRRKPKQPAMHDAAFHRPKPKVSRPAPGPPTGLSEQDPQKVTTYVRRNVKAVKKAKQGKPFNANDLRSAIASGVAPDVH